MGKKRTRREPVIDAEVRFHLEERTAELIARGIAPREARRRAEREFGDIGAALAYCERQDRVTDRRRRLRRGLRAMLDDFVAAVRSLLRRPRTAVAPLAVLAVAVALNSLVFTVVRAVLIVPPPLRGADRAYVVEELQDEGALVRASYPMVVRWRDAASSLEAVAAYTESAFPVMTSAGPAHVTGLAVTAGYFDLFEQPGLTGPGFAHDDHRVGAPRRVIVSESFWRRALAGRPDVVGASLRMNGRDYEIVGVARAAGLLPGDVDLWVPFAQEYPGAVDVVGAKFLAVFARARPGVERETVERELGELAATVDDRAAATRATPVVEHLAGDVATSLWMLQGAVLLVLLAASANAGGMLLVRTLRRGSELAVRTSLGAARWRVGAVLLYEGLILGLGAGVLGLLAAAALLEPALALVPRELPRATAIRLDAFVSVWALVVAALTGLVTSLGPAVAGTRQSPAGLLRDASGGVGESPWLRRGLEGLVVAQIALAVFLTAGAGLLVRSFVATVSEDPGFDPTRVTVLEISLPTHAYPDGSARIAFAGELLERAAALPGVEAAALGRNLPITGSNMTSPLSIEDVEGASAAVQVAKVSAGYFDVLRIDLVRGTGFGDEDRPGGLPRMIVSDSVRDPRGAAVDVGARARSFFGGRDLREVVGVTRSVRHGGLRSEPAAVVYEPFFQSGGAAAFALLLRSEAVTSVTAAAARALVQDIDPELPADRVATMSSHVRRSLAEPRFYLVGLTTFGALTVALAIAGCHAGLAHRVAARRREIGVRMALGASGASVRAAVVRRGLTLSGMGATIGLVGALPAARVLDSQLYGIEATDPVTYVMALIVLLAAGALASDLPARRAAALDPATTLRD